MNSRQVQFSLVLCTKGRSQEIATFLDSLVESARTVEFELIVVDQNEDDRVESIFERYKFSNLIYQKVDFSGLSRARNYGIKFASGEYIGFPDDDCVYSKNLLDDVACIFRENPDVAGISGSHVETFSGESQSGRIVELNRYNVWTKAISFTLFFRASEILNCSRDGSILFNEELGVGSSTIWGSGEETDFVLKLLGRYKKIIHVPRLRVAHPYIRIERDGECEKAYRYSRGRMKVLDIHGYSFWFKAINVIYPIVKMISHPHGVARRRFYCMQFLGRIHGLKR